MDTKTIKVIETVDFSNEQIRRKIRQLSERNHKQIDTKSTAKYE